MFYRNGLYLADHRPARCAISVDGLMMPSSSTAVRAINRNGIGKCNFASGACVAA